MALTSEQLPNLMNGISQQAITMRMPSQGEDQVNALSSIVDGNIKRPPAKLVAKLSDTAFEGAYIHTINRDINERYVTVMDGSGVRVFDVDGTERPVTFTGGAQSYVSSSDPQKDLRAVTVADYTFILNRETEVQTTSEKAPSNSSTAIVFIKSVNYGVSYSISIDGVEVASFRTDETDDSNADVSTEEVISELRTKAESYLGGGWSFKEYSPVLFIEKDDGTDFTIEADDDDGGQKTDVVKDKIQRFTDLPVVGKRGYIVEITGDDDSAFDNYYLKFVPNNDGLTYDRGTWEETVSPGVKTSLDPETLPHSLVRMTDGTFEVREVDWGKRIAGDLDSAPWPSFVGKKINDIYFDRRRLCFLADDNVVMSASGDFFRFFPETVLSVLDDGPIDIAASGTKVSILRHAVPFNKKILLFSDQTQFVIEDEYLLASKPPGVKELTGYESKGDAKPVGVGRTLFFPVDSGDYAGVLEYYVMDRTETTDASEVTEHVPEYIPAPITKIAASENSKVVLALSSSNQRRVFVYKYHWNGSEKMQSSWSHWEMPVDCKVLNADFINDDCYVVTQYGDGVYLEVINLGQTKSEPGEDIITFLDRRVTEADVFNVSYDGGANATQIEVPYKTEVPLTVVKRRNGKSGGNPYKPATVNSQSENPTGDGTLLTLRGDWRQASFFVGVLYSHAYTFSEPVLKTRSSTGGGSSVLAGRLQIMRWHIAYADTGYFRVEVKNTAREKYVYTQDTFRYAVTGTQLGGEDTSLGVVGVSSGTARFPVRAKAGQFKVTIINDSFLPSAFTAAEWEGRFNRNTSRI